MSTGGKELLARAVKVARNQGPSAEQSARLAKALGITPTLPPPPPAAAAAAGHASLVPWIGGTTAVVVAGLIGTWAAWPEPHAAPVAHRETARPSIVIRTPEPEIETRPLPYPEAPAPPPPVQRVRRRPAPIAASERVEAPPPVESAPQSRAREEAELIQRAESALDRDPGLALRLARQHQQNFAGGLLGQEREVIAIDALLRLGRRSSAEQRARAFDAHHRGSVHSRRIHRLLDAH